MTQQFIFDVIKRRLTASKYMKDIFKIYVDSGLKTHIVVVVSYIDNNRLTQTEMALNRLFNDIENTHVAVRSKGKLFTYGITPDAEVIYSNKTWNNVS